MGGWGGGGEAGGLLITNPGYIGGISKLILSEVVTTNGHETAKYGPYQAQNSRQRSCTPEYQFRDPRIYKNISKFAIDGGGGGWPSIQKATISQKPASGKQ